MAPHLSCSLSEVVNCGGIAPQCRDGCVGHLHSRCNQMAKWRITTSNPDPTVFFQQYACEQHRDDISPQAPNRAYEPIDGNTLFGFAIKESRAA